MCEQCEAHLKAAKKEAKDAAKERDEAEQEVSPQTSATMTVLTPGPDAGIPSEPVTI